MKRTFILPFAIAVCVSVFFVSCQKEITSDDIVVPTVVPTSSSTDITGTWKFISLEGKSVTTQQTTGSGDAFKTITTSNYTTENNTGTFTIDATNASTNNISYTVNTISKSVIYDNGLLTDSISVPLQFTAPASSATTTYKKVGQDSIYFNSGVLSMSGTTQNTQSNGAKIKTDTNKLYLIQSINQSNTTAGGGNVLSTLEGTYIITFQRQ